MFAMLQCLKESDDSNVLNLNLHLIISDKKNRLRDREKLFNLVKLLKRFSTYWTLTMYLVYA